MKIWVGGVVGLVGGFFVMLLLLREVVLSDGARVTSETAVSVLFVLSAPLVLGSVVGAYLAAQLNKSHTPVASQDVRSVGHPSLREAL